MGREYGSQIFPHNYLQRFRGPSGKWLYVYAPGAKSYKDAIKDTKEVKVVIAQGNPTPIRVNKESRIVTGPPNLVGRLLLLNKNPRKAYFGIAKDPSGAAPPQYLYNEKHLKRIQSKKAAKFVKLDRALNELDKEAKILIGSRQPLHREIGLAIWLNNNTQMRIGSHDNASSVDPAQRSRIIKMAQEQNWSPALKQKMLDQAREKTFGLLTLRNGHVSLDHNGMVSFRFIGKGGKENVYSKAVPNFIFDELYRKLRSGDKETALFKQGVNYKKIWRLYKRHGVTPHMSRARYADSMVNNLMAEFRVRDKESAREAEKRFNEEIRRKVSDYLNHTRNVTERAYIAPKTQKGLSEFRASLEAKVGTLRERYEDEVSEALGHLVLWREIGVGNTVI